MSSHINTTQTSEDLADAAATADQCLARLISQEEAALSTAANSTMSLPQLARCLPSEPRRSPSPTDTVVLPQRERRPMHEAPYSHPYCLRAEASRLHALSNSSLDRLPVGSNARMLEDVECEKEESDWEDVEEGEVMERKANWVGKMAGRVRRMSVGVVDKVVDAVPRPVMRMPRWRWPLGKGKKTGGEGSESDEDLIDDDDDGYRQVKGEVYSIEMT